MNAIVEKALHLWGWRSADYSLVTARENAVFRIRFRGETYALRLHRIGYRTDTELHSELDWMAALSQGGLNVPSPIPSLNGETLLTIDDTQVDVLTWLNGAPLSEHLPSQNRAAIFHHLGQNMAQLHTISDAWSPSKTFERPAWDRDGLLGDTPLWDRFWENPRLDKQKQAFFQKIRTQADALLSKHGQALDYGLIHADLVPTNVMYDGTQLTFIDFDDGGFGFRLFELATALLKYIGDPDYPALRNALIQGYTSKRGIDLEHLDFFILLRALTYVGWNISRIHEEGGLVRNRRFIETAMNSSKYLILKD
ncbi:homoserine kinase [Planktotalea sp.]|uniref:homoserine kinase n=1 Tax=Planktotalea sp. TaxID=2029877 RepID=UPI0035C7A381